jgi:hypothetical protein
MSMCVPAFIFVLECCTLPACVYCSVQLEVPLRSDASIAFEPALSVFPPVPQHVRLMEAALPTSLSRPSHPRFRPFLALRAR